MQAKPRRKRRRRWLLGILVGVIVLAVVAALSSRQGQEEPPVGGGSPVQPVPPGSRLILTDYFYWYDATTGAHLQESGGLRYHIPPNPVPSWRNVEWHKKELADIESAGIDVALAVYWGFDRPQDEWSWKGLPVLAQAWDARQAAGKRPPRIGMFFDTTIVEWRDLTTTAGKEWFYANIRDFFSRIPRRQWEVVQGRPIIFLFTTDWTTAVNQSTFDYVYERFQKDFQIRPYMVRESSWDYPILRWQNGKRIYDKEHPIQTENSYAWGAAIRDFALAAGDGVAAVGPGYDDRRSPGRDTVRDREDGAFYRRNFQGAIKSGLPLLHIETWNEMHEGSGISETVEYGRKYIDLTRELAAVFHKAGQ